MQRILITGGRNPTALELARLLHQPDTQIWLADSLHFPVGRHSRHVYRYVRTPSVAQHPEAYMACLRATVQRHRIGLLIPTYEETFYIARHRHWLADVCTVFCDGFDKLQQLHNKWSFVRMAADCSITTPPTFLLQTAEDLALLKEDAAYYVFKPVYSRFATQLVAQPPPDQLQMQPHPQNPWVAQWFIEGPEYCSYSVAHRGRVQAHVTYQHPYNLGPGSGIYYQQVDHPAIERFVHEFCAQHRYHGQIGFDFIQDERSGKVFVIECNPRTVSGLHLFAPADHLMSAFRGINKRTQYPVASSDRVNLLTFLVYNGWKALRQGQLVQWMKDLGQARDVIFRWDDPWPMFTQNLTLLEFFWLSYKYRLPLAEAISYDIAWNGDGHRRNAIFATA